MDVVLKQDLVPEELPSLQEIQSKAETESRDIRVGTTLFMRTHHVRSEGEYKRRMMKKKKVMHHTAIGWNSFEESAKNFRYIYKQLTERGVVLDRFGMCLDWIMGVPEDMRDRVTPGTGLILNSEEEWRACGQIVPIQPHFGDHMIGSLNSTENVKLALKAGATTIGNIAQYYTYEYPGGLMSKKDRVINMAVAIGIMARFNDHDTLIHSNLDDGFGAMFHDLANLTGWAILERYIVEDLLGAHLSHCFGNLFTDPIMRIVFLMAMDEINTKHSLGSMIYGSTTDYTGDYDRNYGSLSSFVLADTCGQLLFPTGHAVTPIPITEAVRIPSPDEIIQVHVTANMLEEKAKHYAPFLNVEKMTAIKDRLVAGGGLFFERVMNGMDDIGVDTRNPCELFMALKAMGPAQLESRYGAGKEDSQAMRGRIPIQPTDIVWTINHRKDVICQRIKNLEHSLEGVPAVVASTDVHEFGKEIVKSVLEKAGMTIFDLGANVEPDEIADTLIETDAKFILLSTFNGIALTYAKKLQDVLKKRQIQAHVIMGGLLNENIAGSDLPVEVSDDLTKRGIICSKSADELVDIIKAKLNTTGGQTMSTVSIIKVQDNTEQAITKAVRQAVEAIGGLEDIIKPGFHVLINPNLVAKGQDRFSGAVTRYEVCKAIADMVKELGADPVIAESSAAGVDTEEVLRFAEYDKLREQGYAVLDLKKEKTIKIPAPKGHIVKELWTWEPVAKADAIISVPVMKTHDQTEVTLGIKNLKGLIQDGEKKQFHKLGVFGGVVDLNQAIPRVLTIVDGITGQEGLGPIFGEPVHMNLVIASKDCVAADAVTSAVMGYDPEEVRTTVEAHERGLGEMDLQKIDIKGEPIDTVKRRFKRATEVKIEGVPPFTIIEDAKACTGCKATLISAIMDMKAEHIEYLLEGKTIVLGPVTENRIPQDVKPENLIFMGACTAKLWSKGTPCKGCPPNNSWLIQAVAGDRMQIGRRYAQNEKE